VSHKYICLLGRVEKFRSASGVGSFSARKENMEAPCVSTGSKKKPASYLHRTAQPHTLAIFRSWGSSAGAGRIRLAGCKYSKMR